MARLIFRAIPLYLSGKVEVMKIFKPTKNKPQKIEKRKKLNCKVNELTKNKKTEWNRYSQFQLTHWPDTRSSRPRETQPIVL